MMCPPVMCWFDYSTTSFLFLFYEEKKREKKQKKKKRQGENRILEKQAWKCCAFAKGN